MNKKTVEYKDAMISLGDLVNDKAENIHGLEYQCVYARIKTGQTAEEALSKPAYKRPPDEPYKSMLAEYKGVHPEIVKAAVATPFNLNHFLEVSEMYKDALPRDPYGKSAHAWKPKSRLKAKSKQQEEVL